MFHLWKGKLVKHACVCEHANTYTCVHACEWLNTSSGLQCLWKPEGKFCSISWLCMMLMNTLIGPHEDRPDCDRPSCVYCVFWLDERGHDDGCLPLWQGRHVSSEMCYLMKCSSKLVDRNNLNTAHMMSLTVYHTETSIHVYFYRSIFTMFSFLSKLTVQGFSALKCLPWIIQVAVKI